MMGVSPRACPHTALSSAIAGAAPRVHAVLLEHRSKTAVAAVDPARDAVMIWGAEHAGTIGAELTAAGWARRDLRRWVTVGRLPPLAVSLADLVVVAAGAGADTFREARAEALAQ